MMLGEGHVLQRLDSVRELTCARWVAIAWQASDGEWKRFVSSRKDMVTQSRDRLFEDVHACWHSSNPDSEAWSHLKSHWKIADAVLHEVALGDSRSAYYAVLWDGQESPHPSSQRNHDWLELALGGTVLWSSQHELLEGYRVKRQAILETATLFSAAMTESEVVKRGLSVAMRLVDAQGAAFYEGIPTSDSYGVSHVEAHGELGTRLKQGMPFGVDMAKELSLTGGPTTMPWRFTSEGVACAELLLVPIGSRESVQGVLCLARTNGHLFSQLDSGTLALFGRQLTNVCEQQKLLAKLKESNHELSVTQSALVETARLQTLGEIAATIAHDFNNVLGGLLGRVQLLQHAAPDSRTLVALEKMERMISDGESTVRRLQDAARVRKDSGRESQSITALMREVFAEVGPALRTQNQIHDRQIVWMTNMKPTRVKIDAGDLLAGSLRAFLTELAARSPEDCVIEIRTDRDGMGDMLQFVLTGPRPLEFSDWQWHALESCAELTHLVTQQSGTVEFHGPEQEAAFTLRWSDVGSQGAPDGGKEPSYRILVVDDDADVREVLCDLLRVDGHTVSAAADGAEALHEFTADKYDIVFTDLGMPGISGWQVAEHVKRVAPHMPVIMVTGWGAQIEPEKIYNSGVDRVMAKPFQWLDVLETLRDVMRRAHSGISAKT
jgi:CheY-like chemotaxis protein/signal transduction histidine kinase